MIPQNCQADGCFLCRNCLPEWRQAIEGSRQVIHINKGQRLFKEGDPIKGVFFIRSGAVKVHQSWGDSREMILRFAGPGDVVGHRGLTVAGLFPVSATALQSGSACFVSTAFFETTAKTNPGFLYAMMQLYAGELQRAERRIRDLALLNVSARLAGSLLALREEFSENDTGFIRVPVTRQDIAFYAGTTYETVFRTLRRWETEGLIRCSGKQIRLVRPDLLRRLASPGAVGDPGT